MDTNTNTTVNLTVFVIPNHSSTFKEIHCTDKNYCLSQCTVLGVPCSNDPNEKWIQVWISGDINEENDNFSAHGYSGHYRKDLDVDWVKKPTAEASAPHRLPLSFLKNAKEGEVRALEAWNGAKVLLKFEQRGHRYERFGNFEDVVRYVTE